MPGSFDNPADRDAYFKEVVNQGERKGQTRGKVIDVPFPSRSKFNAQINAYAPGCGGPTPTWTGQKIPCGASLEGEKVFCPYCQAQGVAESYLNPADLG